MIGICSLSATSALRPEIATITTMKPAATSWVAAGGISPHVAGQKASSDSASPKQ